jgi:hypothetical protein
MFYFPFRCPIPPTNLPDFWDSTVLGPGLSFAERQRKKSMEKALSPKRKKVQKAHCINAMFHILFIATQL